MLFGTYVITVGNPRNTQLRKLKLRGSTGAVLVQNRDRSLPVSDSHLQLMASRRATTGEVDCALGHRAAYEKMVSNRDSWALILEDDAIPVPEVLEDVAKRLPLFPERIPTIISCYSNKDVVISKPGIHKVVPPPAGTVGYFINLAAARLAVSFPVVQVPSDWPLVFVQECEFYVVKKPISINLHATPSLIGTDRIEGSRRFAKLSTLFGIRMFQYWLNGIRPSTYWKLELSRQFGLDRHITCTKKCKKM